MIEFIVIGGVIAVFLFLTAAVVLPILLSEYLHLRRAAWIAVRPTMAPVGLDQLPALLSVVLDKAQPVLEQWGFRLAATAHAPVFQADATWFHLLLINRAAGEWASVTCYAPAGATPFLNLTFAAEFADGELVVSEWSELFPDAAAPVALDVEAIASQARSLYALHLSRMNKLANREGRTPVLPAESEKLRWLQAKAAAVTAELAKHDFELDASGHNYVPTRRHALRLVARNFSAIPVRRPRPSPTGFPVLIRADGRQ